MTHPLTQPVRETLCVVIPLTAPVENLERAVMSWHDTLTRTGRTFELLLVDDTGNAEFSARTGKLAEKFPVVRVLKHETPRGFGACLRTAFAESRSDLFFYTALDYPYTPADIVPMLKRIGDIDELLQKPIDLVSGCRRGVPVPGFWAAIGRLFRGFCRVALGLPREKLPGWLGFREHRRSWQAWFIFGNPLTDPNSAFKLIRRSLLDRFPIQCDGDFVHVELVAKATFLTTMMDEQPLTPTPAAIPATRWDECGKILTRTEFHPPATGSTHPADPPETVLSEGGIDGARTAAEPVAQS